MDEKMAAWLTDELNKRGWSLSELGRRADLSVSTLSNVLSGATRPGLQLCVGLSKAFDMPPETVLHKMGILTHYPMEDDISPVAFINEVTDILRHLSTEERRLIYETARLHHQHEKKKNSPDTSTNAIGYKIEPHTP